MPRCEVPTGAPAPGHGGWTMAMKRYGFTRREIRGGSGSGDGVASEHFEEMLGSTEFHIYRHHGRKVKGYEALKEYLESQGCEFLHLLDSPAPVGQGYETLRITSRGNQIPATLLKRAHNWAHQRNLLHMFHKKR